MIAMGGLDRDPGIPRSSASAGSRIHSDAPVSRKPEVRKKGRWQKLTVLEFSYRYTTQAKRGEGGRMSTRYTCCMNPSFRLFVTLWIALARTKEARIQACRCTTSTEVVWGH